MKVILIFLGLTLSLVSCGDSVSEKETKVSAYSKEFESQPSQRSLRRLINFETDTSVASLQMALVGRAFSKHPDEFKKLSSDLRTENELDIIKRLRDSPEMLFGNHPEMEPVDFKSVREKATWLGGKH